MPFVLTVRCVLLGLSVVLLGSCGHLGILLGKDTDDSCCDLVVDDRLVVFADNVDTEFLETCKRGRERKS